MVYKTRYSGYQIWFILHHFYLNRLVSSFFVTVLYLARWNFLFPSTTNSGAIGFCTANSPLSMGIRVCHGGYLNCDLATLAPAEQVFFYVTLPLKAKLLNLGFFQCKVGTI